MIYTKNVKTKSLGLAIVLTLFLGPLGLFYASISGGLIMTFMPILLLVALIFGAALNSAFLLASSAILLIVFAISYWIICVIWAATAVNNHNNRIFDNKRQADLLRKLKVNSQRINYDNRKESIVQEERLTTDRPTLQDWKKENPDSSINDYYRIYGLPQTKSTTAIEQLVYKKESSNNILLYILGVITVLLIVFVVFFYDKETKSFSINRMTNILGVSNDHKEIKHQIENVYFGLINGAYTSQSLSGTTPDNLPFYNSDLSTLFFMGFAPLTMLSGTVSLEPKNINIIKIYENKADVTYDLVLNDNGKLTTKPVNMTLKKIGGKWKLDGQNFIPFDNEQSSQ